MDNIHKMVTQNIPNAHPSRFTYDWENDKTLVMIYNSDRGLIDFLVGLIKGVGMYYKENLKVMKLANDKVQIIFSWKESLKNKDSTFCPADCTVVYSS